MAATAAPAEREQRGQLGLLRTGGAVEGVRALLAKRRPAFSGR